MFRIRYVVPYVGTWIEIYEKDARGGTRYVVPYVGTWIEMPENVSDERETVGRSLRGNVDRNHLTGSRLGVGFWSFPTWERG